MERKEEVVLAGRLQQVKKQRYCFHLVLIDDHQRETRWIYEPQLWKSGPQGKAIPGQIVVCQGYKEIPAVSMRGFPPPEPRYRATFPISLQEQRSLPERYVLNNENCPQATVALLTTNHDLENQIQLVLETLKNPPPTLRWIKSGYWYCFDCKTLQRCFNDISQQQLQDCISTLRYRGDIALVDANEGLFTPVTHEGFIAPALLMVIHGYANYFPSSSVMDDGALLLNEWIEATQRHILGLFNVPENRIMESAMELVKQHYVIVNENERYRRPYI